MNNDKKFVTLMILGYTVGYGITTKLIERHKQRKVRKVRLATLTNRLQRARSKKKEEIFTDMDISLMYPVDLRLQSTDRAENPLS